MTKKHSTKRALLSSVLALLLCLSTFVGTTFAWFTDSVTSANNIIQSGKLDIELYHQDAELADPAKVDSETKLFNDVTLWEPGVMVWEEFTIANKGNLALKYQFTLNVLEATIVNEKSFADMLKVAVVEDDFVYNRENVEAITEWSSLATFISDGELTATETETFGIVIWWQPSENDNDFNMNNGKDGTVSVTVGVNLFATQLSAESDAFGSDYDANAPIVSAPVVLPETGAVIVTGDKNVKVALPEAIVDALPAGVEKIALAVSEPVVEGNTVTFAAIEVVDQNGNIIDLANLGANANITVTLPLPEGATFAEGEEVMIYHDGAYVATAIVTDGVISYEVAHLCEVSVGVIEEPVVNGDTVEIANVAQLIAFAQSVNAGNTYAGKTVVLTADIDLNNVDWTPIGNWDNAFEGTFDGNGKIISNLYINDAEGEGVGFFGVVANATIKNVTIKNVNIYAYSMVAGVVGAAYPATIENCHVTGDVEIVAEWAYVAGIAGYCYYNTQVTGCSTIANGTGLIKSVTRNAVGGITAWLLEGNHSVTNCQVKNLDLVGWTNVGGITGFVHYNNTIADCTVENVTLTKTRVDGNPGIGLIAGGWSYSASNAITIKNNTVSNATMEGNHKVYAAYNELYGSEYGGAITTNFVLENNKTTDIENNLTTKTVVKTGDELKAALANGEDVIFANDITMAAKTTNGYGVTGIVVDGQTIDGNGYTFKVTGAGTTWDSAIYIKGGKIENLKITGAMRGVFMGTAKADVYLENVSFGTIYTFNSDGGNKNFGVYISNSTMNGWTSHSDVHKEVVYTNCVFTEGSGNKYCRPYGSTKFIDCTFTEGFTVDKSKTTELVFENCIFE